MLSNRIFLPIPSQSQPSENFLGNAILNTTQFVLSTTHGFLGTKQVILPLGKMLVLLLCVVLCWGCSGKMWSPHYRDMGAQTAQKQAGKNIGNGLNNNAGGTLGAGGNGGNGSGINGGNGGGNGASVGTSLNGSGFNGTVFTSGCTALALPMTGKYAKLGQKIAAGAQAAEKSLAQNGITMQVHLVDTAVADWLDVLDSLPQECVAVGGPIQPDAYLAAKSRNLTASRAFFAFLPSLDGEGSVAWRFFANRDDQIRTLLRLTHKMGISQYGALQPNNDYGKRMTQDFIQTAEAQGGFVKMRSYTPGATSNWSDLMTSFIGSYTIGKPQETTFQAVFLPDTWPHIEGMLPWLFYQGEDRLILMGTALWEQGLSGKSRVAVENLDLAVFPGAWNPHSESRAAQELIHALGGKADVWAGIGFDFVRFAAALGLGNASNAGSFAGNGTFGNAGNGVFGSVTGSVNADLVNQRLAVAQNMEWSMAPIQWTNGIAAQNLFLFHPISTGFELLNEEAFAQRWEEIKERHQKRTNKK